ncbi:MAG TPA: hypothetical protein VHE30_14375 [Polyangiaceae bacterium]|nr:hypothetical protein [Polyangiaceae bacterium]
MAADANVVLTLPSSALPAEPWSLQQSGSYLYWVGGSKLLRVSKTGGVVQTVATGVAGGNWDPSFTVLDGYAFYLGSAGLMRVPVTGGTPESFAPSAITLPGSDGTFFYWAERVDDAINFTSSVILRRAPVSGGATTQLASFGWDAGDQFPDDLIVVGGRIWFHYTSGSVDQPFYAYDIFIVDIPPAGEQASTLQRLPFLCGSRFVVTAKTVFCGNRSPNPDGSSYHYFAVGLDTTTFATRTFWGGEGMVTAPWAPKQASAMLPGMVAMENIGAASDKNAYAAGVRFPLCGGNTLSTLFPSSSVVTADGEHVFWISGSTLRVLPE